MILRTATIGTLALALLMAAGCGGDEVADYDCSANLVHVCDPGEARPCYDGPEGTEGTGVCKAGTQTCNFLGGGFGPCVGQVLPAPDDCHSPTSFSCDAPSTCAATVSPAEAAFGTPAATAVAVDSQGDVAHLAATSDAEFPGFAVEKRAPDGTLRWRMAASPHDQINCVGNLGIVQAPDDDVIFFGYYADCPVDLGAGELPPSQGSAFIARYAASDGSLRWVRTYPAEWEGLAVGAVATGAIVLTANYTAAGKVGALDLPAPPANGGSYLAMLDASGEPLWAQPFAERHPEEVRVAADGEGRVFTLSKRVGEGSYEVCAPDPPSQAVLSAFEADGTPRFEKVFGDGKNSFYGSGLAVDANGRIAITGMAYPRDEPASFDVAGVSVEAGAFLGVLDPARGDAVWVKGFQGWLPGAVVFDDHGGVILVGSDANHLAVARYTSAGELFSLATNAELQELHWIFSVARSGDRVWVASQYGAEWDTEYAHVEGWRGALHHADF
jgi:hypothetical protein